MIDQKIKDIVNKIRNGEVDINTQSLFFPILIKGLILHLNREITIRNIPVPHFILHVGDDTMYLFNKGQDASIEPLEISNEDYIYNTIPRCIVNPGSIDLLPDQLTSPHSRGNIELELADNIYSLNAEFRRMPMKLNCELKYYVDSYRDVLELAQQIITKLSFIQTFNITYLGQTIRCSYKVPEGFEGEHLTELDGTSTDNKLKTLSLSIEVETNIPVYDNQTVMSTSYIISNITGAISLDNDLTEKINNK